MSMDPNMIAQLLMQKGGQGGQQGMVPQQSALGTGSNLLQQVLMMQQLKQRLGGLPQQPQPPQPGQPPGMPAPMTQADNSMGPGTNA